MKGAGRFLLVTAVGFVALVSASTAWANTTTFTGRFVCEDRGVQLPLAGALVELYAQKTSSGFDFGPVSFDPIGSLVHAVVGQATAKPGDFVEIASDQTGPDGEWSFTVPQTDPNFNFFVAAFLSGFPASVSQYPSTDPIGTVTGTNQNDKDVQDYHTQVFGGGACPVWLGLESAIHGYEQIAEHLPSPSLSLEERVIRGAEVRLQYGVPGPGVPFTDYQTIHWPTDYPAGPQPGSQAAVVHEFWHAVRNFSLGSRDAFFREISTLPARGSDPCARTSPREAFNEGWAEFWAGDFAPAPDCPGVSTSDSAVEGMVAWTLTEMAAGCPDRQRMIEVMLSDGANIHTLDDFRNQLRASCLAQPVDAAKVPRFGISPRVSSRIWEPSARSALAAARAQASRLGRLLPRAERLARRNCGHPPCTGVIAAKLVPSLIKGQLAQQRLLVSTLSAQLSRKAVRQSSGPLTRALLNRLYTTPRTLTRGLARLGELSLNRGLSIAGPLARRDHSRATRRMLVALRADRAAFAKARRRGRLLPGAFPFGALGAGRSQHVPTIGEISFGGFADGTLITTQTQTAGATFGSPQSLAFPAAQPAYVCADGPTVHTGVAVAPACPGGPTGYQSTGTMAHLNSPATSLNVRVGTTQAVPGGFAAEVDAYNAAGKLVTQNAALVGSSTNGQGAGLTQTVQLAAPAGQSIAYVALFFNSYFQSNAQLEFNNLAYTAP